MRTSGQDAALRAAVSDRTIAAVDRATRSELRASWLRSRPLWTRPDWFDLALTTEARELLWLAPGPVLAASLSALRTSGPCPLGHGKPGAGPQVGNATGWPCACQVVVVAAWEAQAAWTAAGIAGALVHAAGAQPVTWSLGSAGPEVTDPAREELATAVRVGPGAMETRLRHARGLVGHPELLRLLAGAGVSDWAARLVLREVEHLEADQARVVIAEVCSRIDARLASARRAWTTAEIRQVATRSRMRLFPDEDGAQRRRAFAERKVSVMSNSDGMATLSADLAHADAIRVHRRLTSLANGLRADGCSDDRTQDQLRADVLVDLVLGRGVAASHDGGLRSARLGTVEGADSAEAGEVRSTAAAGAAGAPPSIRPEIQVIVELATLTGLNDNPAELTGVGPIPAGLARDLAADGRWRSWVRDADGAVIATGSAAYVPSAAVARTVRAREPHCRMPGCRQPSYRADLDHTIPYPSGSTTIANLGPLCRRHHVMKTHTSWELKPDLTDGSAAGLPEPRSSVESQSQGGAEELARVSSAPGGPFGGPSGAGRRAVDPSPSPRWTWVTPAGFTVHDGPEPPLGA